MELDWDLLVKGDSTNHLLQNIIKKFSDNEATRIALGNLALPQQAAAQQVDEEKNFNFLEDNIPSLEEIMTRMTNYNRNNPQHQVTKDQILLQVGSSLMFYANFDDTPAPETPAFIKLNQKGDRVVLDEVHTVTFMDFKKEQIDWPQTISNTPSRPRCANVNIEIA